MDKYGDSYGPLTLWDVLAPEGTGDRQENNFSICANASDPQPLTVGDTDFYVQHYVFPVQFILGVAGNSINLIVLLDSGIKNRANILLSAMAFCDLAFLICLLPFSLASFKFFYSSRWLSYLFHRYKSHAGGITNMFSMSASWLVLAVSIERFVGVKKPMVSLRTRERRIYLLILAIFVLGFVTNFRHYIEYDVVFSIQCGIIKPLYKPTIYKPDTSSLMVMYLKYGIFVQTILGVAVPVVAVAILNVSLVYYLRRREILPRIVGDNKRPEFAFVDISTFQRQERKVTTTVLAIVSCFTITHLPTLGPSIWERINNHGYRTKMPSSILALLNTLLISGKVLNFVLFCLSSAHFRHRTIVILSARCRKSSNRNKTLSMTISTNIRPRNSTSFHHSDMLSRCDSVDIPLQNYQKPSTNSSTGIQRIHNVRSHQLDDFNASQSLLRHDSLEMLHRSTTPPINDDVGTRGNEEKGFDKCRLFTTPPEDKTTTM